MAINSSNARVIVLVSAAVVGSFVATGLILMLTRDQAQPEPHVYDLTCGDELYLSQSNGISGGNYISISNCSIGLLLFEVIVDDDELASYIGLSSASELYLANGTGKVFKQLNQAFGCERVTYLSYHLQHQKWYVRLHPTIEAEYPWLERAIINLSI
jgi:hypothetical protein